MAITRNGGTKLGDENHEAKRLKMDEYFQKLNAAEEAVPRTDDRDEAIKQAETIERSQGAIAREALREFAGDVDAEVRFAVYLPQEYRDERIAIYERALKDSTNDETRLLARANYAMILAEIGEVGRAVSLVEPLPLASMSKSVLMPIILKWGDRAEARETALESIREMSNQIAFLRRRFGIDESDA